MSENEKPVPGDEGQKLVPEQFLIAREPLSSSHAKPFPSLSEAKGLFVKFVFGHDFESRVLDVKHGTVLTVPEVPEVDGYTIEGWYTDSERTVLWDFNEPVRSHLTLFAGWHLIVFSIRYFLNHGINHPENPSSFTVLDPDIVLREPTRPQSVFISWHEDVMFAGPPVEIIKTSWARNVTVYAKWSVREVNTVEAPAQADERYEGDPKLYFHSSGSDLNYIAGQPFMERGLENQILIQLFTRKSWCGNVFLPGEKRAGSDFEATCSGSITMKKLADIENSALRALKGKLLPKIKVTVTNPRSDSLWIDITVEGKNAVSLTREGALWNNQRSRPDNNNRSMRHYKGN